MSLQYSDTSTYKGIIQEIERELGFDQGYISGNTAHLKHFTAGVNLAWDHYVYLAIKSSGTWQWDDSNHTDHPIIKTNLVDGQREYSFTTDEGSNLILDIERVFIIPSASATEFQEIYPVDAQSDAVSSGITSETTSEGVPYSYDKTGNVLFLDPIPSYNKTSGLKVYINREASYFTTADTTKKPGCPGIHHRYFALRAAYDYARRKNLAVAGSLRNEIQSFEGDEENGVVGSIERYFARRSRDERKILTPKRELFI
jgi:hypothetical protein